MRVHLTVPYVLDGVDFFQDPALVADPYELYRRMRPVGPVLREPTQGVYIVTGYEEAQAILGNPRHVLVLHQRVRALPGFPVRWRGAPRPRCGR